MSDWFHVQAVAPGVHALIESGRVNTYLVEGNEYAALIDTGLGLGNIRAVAESLTRLPIVVMNTHGHWDHIGGNHWFEHIGIHPAEADMLIDPRPPATMKPFLRRLKEHVERLPDDADPDFFRVLPSRPTFYLEQGQVMDLGGRQLQVWHTPGHSPGSVCFLDENERLLFTGDTVYEGAIYLHLPGGEVAAMERSLRVLAEMAWDINLVLPAHGLTPTDGRLILEVAEGLRRTVAGEIPLKKGLSYQGAVRVAAFERFLLFFPVDWRPAAEPHAAKRAE